MGLLNDFLSGVDNLKRKASRNIWDAVSNPSDFANMTAARMQEDRYGGPEEASAMKSYLSRQPYDQVALQRANDTLRNNAINESLGAITVWHGSPHKFNKFDMSKIGTGEGAQAYGHGIYMAEAPEVAQNYKNGLSNRNQLLWKDIEDALPDALKGKAADFSDAILSGKKFDDLVGQVKLPWQKAVLKQSQAKLNPIIEAQQSGGALYKVDIPDEAVSRFLDWDKPLSQQAPEVQSALSSMPQVKNAANAYLSSMGKGLSEEGLARMKTLLGDPMSKISGSAAYKALTEGESANAAEILKKQGIPGIRYLDGGSRGQQAGTSNFVLFDDQMPRILEINGTPTGLQPWKPNEWQGLLGK